MRTAILHSLNDAVSVIEFLKTSYAIHFIEELSEAIAECFQNGGKVLIAGNGGSLCDAAHFAEELTGGFREKRKALPAIALNDAGHLTCVGNDFGFEDVFSRAIEALGKPGDIFIALTTSGNSINLLNAIPVAKEIGMKTASFLGKTGGKMKGMSDFELIVPGFTYSDRIQEAHMTAIHILIEMVENHLFAPSACRN